MRYIFTVTTGRSGQNSLFDLLNRHVPDSYVAFEEPRPKKIYFRNISGFLAGLETRFHRKFIETDELLGRGKVLKAFELNDQSYLNNIVSKRLESIHKTGCKIYIDVSKYFARGLHHAFAHTVGDFSLIFLVRDPLLNMRSFLNRNKNFTLDNNLPSAESNLFRIPDTCLHKGELYLWAWCEMNLRFLDMIKKYSVKRHVTIRTEELALPEIMDQHMDALGLKHSACTYQKHLNRNPMDSIVSDEDIEIFDHFVKRIPSAIFDKIGYLHNYNPREKFRPKNAS